jgi:hypothetical protein
MARGEGGDNDLVKRQGDRPVTLLYPICRAGNDAFPVSPGSIVVQFERSLLWCIRHVTIGEELAIGRIHIGQGTWLSGYATSRIAIGKKFPVSRIHVG